jgi:hypothetical protein
MTPRKRKPGREIGSRPRTGDPRQANQPLKIDRLPSEVHQAILQLKNVVGLTWLELEELSAKPFGKNWISGTEGFVDWENLPTPVLELFPDMRLPHSNLHRWFDLRVSQVQREVMARAAQAREIAEAFAGSTVEDGDEAVLNAARDQIMGILSENASEKGRMAAAKSLIVLAEVMQSARANDIKERKVVVEEKKIKILEEREATARRALEEETARAQKKLKEGGLTAEDIDRIRVRTFGMPPLAQNQTQAQPAAVSAHG